MRFSELPFFAPSKGSFVYLQTIKRDSWLHRVKKMGGIFAPHTSPMTKTMRGVLYIYT